MDWMSTCVAINSLGLPIVTIYATLGEKDEKKKNGLIKLIIVTLNIGHN